MSLLEKASLVITPNGVKAGKLYSVIPNTTLGDMNVVRATTATRVNSLGLIENVGLNVPRLDYTNASCPSILVEPQRTNLVTHSEQFDDASYDKIAISITANTENSPSGSLTADTLVGNGVNGFHAIQKTQNFTSGITHTLTFYLKKGTNNFAQLILPNASFGSTAFVNFDLNTGVLGTVGAGVSALITNANNGWYRCSISGIATSTTLSGITCALIFSATSERAELNSLSTSFFIWGAQLEQGSFATSYIPTVASTVTRNADLISKTGISSLIGQTEGTILSDFNITNNDLSSKKNIFSVDDNSYYVNFISAKVFSNNFFSVTFRANSLAINFVNLTLATNGNHKIALRYGNGFVSIFIDGVLRNTQTWTNSFTNSLSQIFIGKDNNEPQIFNDRINSFQLYKTALTDAECIALTTL